MVLPFEARRRPGADVDVVEVFGELDMRAARELHPLFAACVDEGSGAVIADYRGVRFVDSIAIGQLFTVRRQLAQDLRRLLVVSDMPKVRRVLAMTGADQSVAVFSTMADALAAVREDGTL